MFGMQAGIPNGTAFGGLVAMALSKPEPLIDSVYARLRDLILSNNLRAGEKLVDRDLADRLGVSRTPVREALGRLTMMGLVENRARRGFYVKQYTADEMSDLYEYRKILEKNAARLAATNANPDQLAEFERILAESVSLGAEPSNQARTVEVDLKIHMLIAKSSGNKALYHAIQNMMDKVMCFIWVDWVDASVADAASIAAAHDEHRALIERIMAGDADGAAEHIGVHIDNARDGLAAMLKRRDDLRDVVLAGSAAH
jgi:DNA-binding GntR family transcriptional regulator